MEAWLSVSYSSSVQGKLLITFTDFDCMVAFLVQVNVR